MRVWTKLRETTGVDMKNDYMLEKRGCHELVYLRETRIAMSEQSNFASSLIVLLFMYKGA